MKLLIDIGNSSVKVALAKKDKILEEYNFSSNVLEGISGIYDENPGITRAIISSVGKPIENKISKFLHKKDVTVLLLNEKTPIPISNEYDSKKTLGKDRIAAAIGGWHLYPNTNLLIIDCGSAITYEFVTKEGSYLGGNISPGLNMRFQALHEFTNRLPRVKPIENYPFIGNTTERAIQAGVINGIIFELESYIVKTGKKFPDFKVILTGGDAIFFVKQLKRTIFVVSNLVLVGLNRILDYND